MKYNIAMQLLSAGIIKQEEYDLVSKILEGVTISKENFEQGDLTNLSERIKVFLGFANGCSFEIKRVVDEKFTLIYKKLNLLLAITMDELGQLRLHINETVYNDSFDCVGSYILEKGFDENQIKVEFYDKAATEMRQESRDEDFYVFDDLINNYFDAKNYQQLGLLPDKEGVIEEDNVIELVCNLIRPSKTNIGSFEEELNKVTKFNNEKHSNK